MAESFRWAMITHLVMGKQEFFQPLTMAAEWARRSQIRVLEASVLLSAAENYAAIGDAARSGSLLELAAAVMRRRECGQGEIGARFQYVSAHVFYLQGDAKRGIGCARGRRAIREKGWLATAVSDPAGGPALCVRRHHHAASRFVVCGCAARPHAPWIGRWIRWSRWPC